MACQYFYLWSVIWRMLVNRVALKHNNGYVNLPDEYNSMPLKALVHKWHLM